MVRDVKAKEDKEGMVMCLRYVDMCWVKGERFECCKEVG